MSSSSNNKNNNNKDSNQKKRKMWRTVNVTAGSGPSQSMTPEAAAKYIQQAASQSASSRNSNGGREVKISFGPSRPPSNSSNSNNNSSSNNSNNSRSINLGNLDLQALKETAAAAAAASKPKGGGKHSNNNNNKDGLPCTEAEMKALMSMFVEIMGMSMDSEKMKAKNNHNNNNNKKGPVFMFGNSNGGIPMPPGGWSDASAETMAAATAGFFADGASWEAIRRTYGGMMNDNDDYDDDDDDDDNDDYEDGSDEEDDDDDSLPNLDDMRQLFQAQQKSHFEAMARSRMNSSSGSSSGFNREIPPSDWESLEQVAMDDALEAEERARKAAKKREKKQRKKQKQKEEAAQKAAEAAMKKKEKAILSWRSRVVSACQSGEVSKLDALLHESPLRKAPDEESSLLSRSHILPHLEFLLPNSVAKNRSLLNRGKESRKKLAEYVLCQDIPIVFQPLRSGRTALHSACFQGDLQFLKLVLERVRDYEDTEDRIPSNYLDQTCTESGWSLLHYASVAGSTEILEILLQEGCNIATITDDTHTWRKSDGKGVTARELIQYMHRNEHEKVLETHGVALQDMINTFCSNHSERRNFQSNLHRVLMRLTDIETNGYSPPKQNNAASRGDENEDSNDAQKQQQESASSRKRKKKKKKKQAQKAAEEAKQEAAKAAATQEQEWSERSTEDKDPLVMALIGMGFAEQQINAAVKACGGTNRATADDLVTWILGQDADGNDNSSSGPSIVHEAEITAETTIKTTAFEKVDAAAQEQEEAAKRLAMKREEQRRRNRAWNDSQQSRQTEAAKAKAAKAMMVQRQVVAPPPPAGYAAAYPTLQSTMSSGSAASSAAAAAAPPPQVVESKPAPKSAAVPKPAIVPKKILSKPVAAAPKRAPGPSVKPTPTTSVKPAKIEKPAAALAIPKILKKPEAEKPAPKAVLKAAPPTKPPPKVDSPPEIRNIVKEQPVVAKPVPVLAQMNPPTSNAGFSLPSGLPVSSVPMVPPPQSSAPPPGFMAPSPPPNMQPNMPPPGVNFPPLDSSMLNHPTNGMGLPMDQGQMGEIRATAKAFVPTSFGSSIPGGDPGLPPLSGAFANPQPSAGMPPIVGGAPEGKSMIQSAFAPGILSGGLGGAPGLMPGDNLNGQDRMPSMTPISTDSTTNTTTSLSGFEESGLAGIPLGFGMGIPQHTGGTSSLLDSIAAGPAPVEASSIWGGPQGGPALDTFSSLGLGGLGADNNQYDDKNNAANATLWGNAARNNPANSNQGSIW
mmetsp:Transcript_10294/g.24680  ORF Transcript_10294/g.24680 Transcript_10294/m.24680 type:complete len:1250 (+) Transcript_10294:257-4006(+)